MELNLEQRLQMLLGQQIIENMALRIENEKLKVQVAASSAPEAKSEPEIMPNKDQ